MAGIYIHIPFCKSRCRYCDFFSTTHLEKKNAYIDAVIKEWETYQNEWKKLDIHTIYIGGGTPSLLSAESLYKLLHSIFKSINTTAIHEITLEANPGDITTDKIRAWRTVGINRLSIGVQTFNDNLLHLVGRRHNANQAIEAVKIAQGEGITNISIDLMYALPSQTMVEWQTDINQAIKLNVPHISCYGLIYEDGTTLTKMLEQGMITAVDEELEITMYDYLVDQLTQNGYEHYEVSNFSLPGQRSRHNSSYWNDTPYIGLGAGAHSYDGKRRWWNIADIDQYITQAINHTLTPELEIITQEHRHMEQVMLGLRTSEGVKCTAINMDKAQTYISKGLLELKKENIVATTKGYHILNRIIEELL
ncbi:MAG: radical SAM family heme chaperone HemW [Paludibacteraceae bacterium]|nr:radical SAM family heme chaperone HemW [Paludibacteraceae bacterium]